MTCRCVWDWSLSPSRLMQLFYKISSIRQSDASHMVCGKTNYGMHQYPPQKERDWEHLLSRECSISHFKPSDTETNWSNVMTLSQRYCFSLALLFLLDFLVHTLEGPHWRERLYLLTDCWLSWPKCQTLCCCMAFIYLLTFHVCQHTLLYKVGLIMTLHIKEYFCKIDLGFYLEPTINHGP